MPATSLSERRARFRALHKEGCFLLPNPWDIGSARWLAAQGFKALASTSSGYAFSRGRPDCGVELAQVLAHLRELAAATDLPLNADFEDGHGATAGEVAANVRACVETGVAGLSIEDSTGNPGQPLYPLAEAVERMKAARAAIDASGGEVLLVGRAECFFAGLPDLDETIRRLRAYSEAGADCLYAPGLSTADQISAVVKAVAPKPVNVLMGPAAALSFSGLQALGVRRISTGGALALSAWSGFQRAAEGLKEGRFDCFDHHASHQQLGELFGRPA